MSHYRMLGVPAGADRAEIRAAYLRAAREHHPDLGPDDPEARRESAERMVAINEAWRVLGDPTRRRVYDHQRIARAAGARQTTRSPGPAPSAPAPRPGRVPGRAPAGGRGNPLVLLPVALLGLGGLQLGAALLLGLTPLLASGVATLAAATATFVAAPLMMLASGRSTRRPGGG